MADLGNKQEKKEYYVEGYYDPQTMLEHGAEKKERSVVRKLGTGRVILFVLLVLIGALLLVFVAKIASEYELVVTNDEGNVSFSFNKKVSSESQGQTSLGGALNDLTPTPSPDLSGGFKGAGVNGATMDIESGHDYAGQFSFSQIYQNFARTVVSVYCRSENEEISLLGVVLSQDGCIITNSAAASASMIVVTVYGGESYQASVIGCDEATDLAVLSIEAQGLVPASFGDSEKMTEGDSVAAIGVMVNGSYYITSGIISAIDRSAMLNGIPATVMLTNTQVSENSSGGPVFNRFGQVVGIIDMGLSGYYSVYGVNGVIPTNVAKPIINELLEKGYVSGRPVLGITMTDVPAAMSAYLGIPRGVLIGYVNPLSDCFAKGIERGDIIVSVNGSEVDGTDELNRIKNAMKVGETLALGVWRNGEIFYLDVLLMDNEQLS